MTRVATKAGVPLELSYVYDTPVPSQLAAPIQIFNTCRQLCELGVATTIYTGVLTVEGVDAALDYYGLTPHPLLNIVPIGEKGRPRRQLWQQLRQAQPAGVPPLIMSRGEQGVALFSQLRRLPRRLPPHSTARYIYEAHRLCFTEVGRWQPPQPGAPPVLSGLRRRWRAWRMWQQERRAVEEADGLVCLTQGVAAALREEFHVTAPTLILPSGTHLPITELPATALPPTALPPSQLCPFAGRDIDILYVGKLKARKGIFDLVAALRHLPGRSLWLVGGDAAEQAAVQAYAQAQGVWDQLVLPGYVEPTQVAALYRRARVGVCPLPSGTSEIAERFTSPLKVLEMMAHGVPIVGTAVPSLQEILVHAQTALLVEPNAPAALAAAIRTLLQDEKQAQQLASAAGIEVQRYSWAKRAEQLYEFLRDLSA